MTRDTLRKIEVTTRVNVNIHDWQAKHSLTVRQWLKACVHSNGDKSRSITRTQLVSEANPPAVHL